MQDFSYIYVPGMVLTNTEITPHSHNTKQLRNAPGQFSVQRIPIKSRMQHFFLHILSVSFCFCKICINNTFRNIAEVSISRRGQSNDLR